MHRARFIFSYSLTALLVLAGTRPMLAGDPHDPQPVTISNPDVSFGAGATSITVHGMKKGQADGPNDAKPLKQLNNSSSGNNGKTGGGGGSFSDPAAQSTSFTSSVGVTPLANFEGLGNGFGGFSV